MSRSLLLLLVLLAAPAWAQDFEGLVVSQGAFGATNSSVVRVSGVFAPPSSSTLASGRIYTQGAEIIGDRPVQSNNPLLEQVNARVDQVFISYPHPDYRD